MKKQKKFFQQSDLNVQLSAQIGVRLKKQEQFFQHPDLLVCLSTQMGVSMNISEIAEAVTEFFDEVIKQKCRIISIMSKEDKWEVLCEVNVDPDYTTRRGLGDIVERYEVLVDESFKIAGFYLKETKRKVALDEE